MSDTTDPQADFEEWCDEHLPELYDTGMFDSEEIHNDVWDATLDLAHETFLDFIDDEDEREALSDTLTDAAEAWFHGHHVAILSTIAVATPAAVSDIMCRPQVAQHSAEWMDRRFRISATEMPHILDGRRAALLRQKLSAEPIQRVGGTAPVAIAQDDGTMNPTSWGHRFEPLVRRVFEEEIAGRNTVCDTLGSFRHRTLTWLSASPDGLITSGPLAGRLVEIKSPKSRIPGEFVPSDYYIQMQVQAEVCDVDAVEFIEAQFQQKPITALNAEDYTAIRTATWKGRIQVWGRGTDDPESWCYRMSPPANDLEDTGITEPAPDGLYLLEESIWWLVGWFPRTVLRNMEWWETVGRPAAEEFWTELSALREAGVSYSAAEEATTTGWIGSSP